jgi:hypothetical protein
VSSAQAAVRLRRTLARRLNSRAQGGGRLQPIRAGQLTSRIFLQQRVEARLDEVLIASKGIRQALLNHHYK